jgi:hypothetical protein
VSVAAVFGDPLVQRMAAFLGEIGIEVRSATLDAGTPCPGLWVERGAVLVDEARLAYPGDLLHEAGHVAVCDPAVRADVAIGDDPGEEMAALAWSYAAARHLGIDPRVVFHDAGYVSGGAYLATAFDAGGGPGTPLLAWFGMTLEAKAASKAGAAPFPHMLRWLR